MELTRTIYTEYITLLNEERITRQDFINNKGVVSRNALLKRIEAIFYSLKRHYHKYATDENLSIVYRSFIKTLTEETITNYNKQELVDIVTHYIDTLILYKSTENMMNLLYETLDRIHNSASKELSDNLKILYIKYTDVIKEFESSL